MRFPRRGSQVFEVPPRNPNFTDRGDLLNALQWILRTRQAGAVVQDSAAYGLGGVGKTQLVVEYAHRFAADYDLVWWIPANEPLAIPGRLAALARRLGLPEPTDEREQISLLFNELSQRDRWLLIFDNATTLEDLNSYWPPAAHGHLLITSRNPAWRAMATSLPVDVFPHEEAVAFLRARTDCPGDPAAEVLATALRGLPLALEHAGAYVKQAHSTLVDYLDLVTALGKAPLKLGTLVEYQDTVSTTSTLALEQVEIEAPGAGDLLRLCAFLATDDLPRALIVRHADQLPDRLKQVVTDPSTFEQTLDALARYSLATVTAHTLSVHQILQIIIREQLDHTAALEWAGAAVRLVRAAFPFDSDNALTWPESAFLLPHALIAAGHAQTLDAEPGPTSSLLNQAGGYFWSRMQLLQAWQLFERALAIREAKFGPDHHDTGTILANLAIVLADLGDLRAGHNYNQRALTIFEAQLGLNHPTTATTLTNLGTVLRDLGDLRNARTAHERALAIREAQLGPNDPTTAASLSNLATIMADLGDLPTARKYHQRALAILEAQLSPDHPTVLAVRQDLADVITELRNRSQSPRDLP
jgi:tetratricopeptide (TPR) repeat protein